MPNIGKSTRLARLLPDKRMLLTPIDDGLSSGPEGGLKDIRNTLALIIRGGADAILSHRGILCACHETIGATPVVLNLTASTRRGSFNAKVQIGDVEDAVRLGATGISAHINISSKYESSMLEIAGRVIRTSESFGMPVLLHIYPRGESGSEIEYYAALRNSKPDEYTRMVRHVARIGVELGADIVKVPYTGTTESFRSVIESCAGVPVVAAGGPHESLESTLEIAFSCMQAGASGVSFGRRVFDHDNPEHVVGMLRRVIHENFDPRAHAGVQ